MVNHYIKFESSYKGYKYKINGREGGYDLQVSWSPENDWWMHGYSDGTMKDAIDSIHHRIERFVCGDFSS